MEMRPVVHQKICLETILIDALGHVKRAFDQSPFSCPSLVANFAKTFTGLQEASENSFADSFWVWVLTIRQSCGQHQVVEDGFEGCHDCYMTKVGVTEISRARRDKSEIMASVSICVLTSN